MMQLVNKNKQIGTMTFSNLLVAPDNSAFALSESSLGCISQPYKFSRQ